MKRIAACFAVLVMLSIASPVDADHNRQTRLEVMSQNLYIGADLDRLLTGESPAALLQTVEQTDFPSRAVEIAEGIDDFNPDVIGLQEVAIISVFDSTGTVLFELDYLDILMGAIAAEGEQYAVAASVDNADVTLPVDPVAGTFARVVDRDVIIYRTDSTTVANPRSANFSTNFAVDLGGAQVEFTRGYTMVDATVGSEEFLFVNTHLEVAAAPCLTDVGPVLCQDLQAAELHEVLADEDSPIVLVGDINAVPGTTAYETFADDGYVDTWDLRYAYNDEPGFTCCQTETLDNVDNILDKRIDLIFISEDGLEPYFVLTTVVGDWDQRKTPGGLWYSDHGGPWAKLYLS